MRRWKTDGPDYHTGYQTYNRDGLIRGPGALIWWMHDNTWSVHVWDREHDWTFKHRFKKLETAKRVAERWLERHRP